ncbi:membrane transport protein-domain-containing protein [Cyathus striatus]|nr:membrane transport protein-domain-containing protein [Cyathus striatus]
MPQVVAAATTSTDPTPIGPLLLVVFTSILEVFLLCLAGYILAGRGILDKKTQKQLNRLNVSLFTPALLFSKVAFFLTPEKLQELWIIPIFFCIVTAVSMSVASFAMAAAMFMNSNSLPIALMQSLVVTVPGLQWDKYDSKNAMLGRALTYLVMYSTLGMVVRWSYGVRLLTQADEEPRTITVSHTHEENAILTERSPLLTNSFPQSYHAPRRRSLIPFDRFLVEVFGTVPGGYDVQSRSSFDVTKVVVEQPQPQARPIARKRTTFYKSFPNSPNDRDQPRAYDSSSPSSESASVVEQRLIEHPQTGIHSRLLEHREHTHNRGVLKRMWRSIARGWSAFNDFMTVPSGITPLQHTLENHMQPVKGAISSAGKCSIPITLVVLGAYFHKEVKDGEKAASLFESIKGFFGAVKKSVVGVFKKNKGKQGYFRVGEEEAGLLAHSDDDVRAGEEHGEESNEEVKPGETKTVWIAVLSRMIITPLLLMPLMVLCARYDYLPVFEDPVFVVSNILLIASPPALTLAQITQAASGDAFERLLARRYFGVIAFVFEV